jgi:VCBS repeat-containing protein
VLDSLLEAAGARLLELSPSEEAKGAVPEERADSLVRANAIVVPDEELLVTGDYQKVGTDLVISHEDGERFVVPGYFASSKRYSLTSPDGAVIPGDIVDILAAAKYAQYAQTEGESGRASIGKVETVTGMATATRNGVVIILQVGDRVFKADLIQTGADSSCGISFLDGTAFSMSANCRMVLNEMVYNPGASGSNALLTLISGTASFVSGQIAKTGDMKVSTPVATMGIRGTVWSGKIREEIVDGRVVLTLEAASYDHGDGSPPGTVEVTNNQGAVLATLNVHGQMAVIRSTGTSVTVEITTMSPQQLQEMLSVVQAVLNIAAAAAPAPTDQGQGQPGPSPNSGGSSGSSTPLDVLLRDAFGPGENIVEVPAPQPQITPPPPDTDEDVTPQADAGPVPETQPQPVQVVVRTNTPPTVQVTPVNETQGVSEGETPESFILGDQVTGSDPDEGDPDFNDTFIPFIPGSAQITEVDGLAGMPDETLLSFITIDQQTGAVTPTSDFRFLPEGETVTYTITFNTQSGPHTVPQTLTFAITGQDDEPVIGGVDGGAVAEDGEAGIITGQLTISDVDLGQSGFVPISDQAAQFGTFSIDADGTWTYTLNNAASAVQALGSAEETLTDAVTVTSLDGTTRTVTITITGENDASVIAGADSGEVTEDGATGEITGQLTITDVDGDATAFQAVPLPSLVKTLGQFTFDHTTGAWTFTVNDTTSQSLKAGEAATETLTVQSLDGTEHTITATIVGTNDAPEFAQVLSFEGDATAAFSGWLRTDTVTVTQVAVATDGASAAQLTTGATSAAELETFLGLAGGTLASNPGPPEYDPDSTTGSAMRTEVFLTAGQTLTFDWQFGTDDYRPFNDFAFFTALGPDGVTFEKLADVFAVGDFGALGWQTFTFTAQTAGTYQIGFGILHTGDQSVDSRLTVDNVVTGSGKAFAFEVAEDAAAGTVVGQARASDIDGDALVYEILPGDGAERFVIDASTGVIRLAEGASLEDGPSSYELQVRVRDGAGLQNTTSVSITVTNDNDAPVASATNSVTTAEDTSSAAVPIGASDPDGDTLTYALKDGAGPQRGSVSFQSGTFTYTPSADLSGPDSFTIVISDGEATTEQMVSVNVTPADDSPTATGLTQPLTVDEDAPATNLFTTAPSVFDVDSNTVTATLTLSSAAAGVLTGAGAAVAAPQGSLIYTVTGTPGEVSTALAAVQFNSAPNFGGTATVAVAISDGASGPQQGTDASGTVTITVGDVNEPPVVAAPLADQLAREDQAFSFTIPAGTFVDEEGAPLTLTAQVVGEGGTFPLPEWLSFVSGTFLGTPDDGDAATLTIRVTASAGTSSTFDDFVLTVGDVNDPPTLLNVNVALNDVSEDAPAPSGAVGTLVSNLVDLASQDGGRDNINDPDADTAPGMALSPGNPQAVQNGTLWYSLDGGASWQPVNAFLTYENALLLGPEARIYFQPTAPNFNGTLTEAITFRAWDRSVGQEGTYVDLTSNGGGTPFSAEADTASITITPADDLSDAVNDTASVAEGGTTTINILGNDVDPDSAPSITDFTQPLHGTLTLESGSFVYAHDGSETASDSFTYTLAGGDTATVSITVTAVDVPSDAVNDTASVAEGGTTTIAVLANDVDPDSAPSIAAFTQGSHGTVILTESGTFTYQHNGSETLSDSFTYTLAGGDTATVNVTVTASNDPPIFQSGQDTGAVTEDDGNTGTPTTTGQLTAFDPEQAGPLTWSVVGGTQRHAADYTVAIDQFKVIRFGNTLFLDEFDSGGPPPQAPLFVGNQSPNQYGLSGAAFAESGGRAIMNADQGASGPGFGSTEAFITHRATLQSYIPNGSSDPNQAGLRTNTPFVVEGRFDLIIPDDLREAYGIRLTDRTGQSAGDDIIELVVRRGSDGGLRVQLRELDGIANTTTNLGAFTLSSPPAINADQIVVRLSHDPANPGVVVPSFDLLKNGELVDTHTLGARGLIFGTETQGNLTDDETWTRAEIVAYEPEEAVSYKVGTYGTLAIDQTGAWTYQLNDDDPDTQALIDADVGIQDVFGVEVRDAAGLTTRKTITIDVNGRTENPVGNGRDNNLLGDRGNNAFLGNGDDDALTGFAGDDTLNGGNGFDEARYGDSPSGVIVNLSETDLFIDDVLAAAAGTAKDGHGGTDALIWVEDARGSSYNDILIGGEEENGFAPGAGNDAIHGGGSFNEAFNVIDELRYHRGPTPQQGIVVTFDQDVEFQSGTFMGDPGAGTVADAWGGTDTFIGIEAVRGTNLADEFYGNIGNQRFRGLGGDDTFLGGGGLDEVDYRRDLNEGGRAGVRVNLSNDAVRIVVNQNGGLGVFFRSDFAEGPAGQAEFDAVGGTLVEKKTGRDGFGDIDTFDSIERIRGSEQHDAIIGDGAANFLRAEGGNDLIRAGGGNDTVEGGGGDDNMRGGGGNDFAQYLVDTPGELVLVAGTGANAGKFFVRQATGPESSEALFELAATTFNNGPAVQIRDLRPNSPLGTDILRDVEFANVVVADGGPSLQIQIAPQVVVPPEGAPFVIGCIFGDTIDLAATFNGNDQNTSAFGNLGNDVLIGGAGNNSLAGGVGDDNLRGRGGDDTLEGGAGDDTLFGDDPGGPVGYDVALYRLNATTDGALTQQQALSGEILILLDSELIFTVSQLTDGTWQVRDERLGAPLGTDILAADINGIQFFVDQIEGQSLMVNRPNQAPVLTVVANAPTYTENHAPFIVDSGLTLTDADGPNLTGGTVAIASGFVADQDALSFVSGYGITGSYDSARGILTLSGSATAAQYQEVLRSVTYVNSSDAPSSANRTITFSAAGGHIFYNPANGRYYEFVSDPYNPSDISWHDAREAAGARSLFGLQGYLATITSAEENAFVASKLPGQVWLGGSDAAAEAQWRWVTGPEGANGGTPFAFFIWASNEPNNVGDEDYLYSWGSSWADHPDGGSPQWEPAQGYLVEYGGMPGDPSLSLSGSVTVHVQPVNDAPTAVDDHIIANTSGAFSVPRSALLFNDADPEDDPLIVTTVSPGLLAPDRVDVPGSTTSLTYTVSDGELTDTRMATIESDFDSLLNGGADGDIVIATAGISEALTGGGGRDVFVLNLPGDGGDAIFDFGAGPVGDAIDLSLLLDGTLVNRANIESYVSLVRGFGSTPGEIFVDSGSGQRLIATIEGPDFSQQQSALVIWDQYTAVLQFQSQA